MVDQVLGHAWFQIMVTEFFLRKFIAEQGLVYLVTNIS